MGTTPPRGTGRRIHLPLVGAVNLLSAVLAVALVAITVPLIGCGGGGADSTSSDASASAEPPTAGADSLKISEYTYAPATLTVPVGTEVRISNEDTTAHTVTSKEADAFESGPIDGGKSGSVTLDRPGTFAYYCVFHPFMKGTITVE